MIYQNLFNNIIIMSFVCVSKIITCIGILLIGLSYNKNKEAEEAFEQMIKRA